MQVFLYYRLYPRDPKKVKAAVSLLPTVLEYEYH